LYDRSKTTILFVPRNITQTMFSIPAQVRVIGPAAFGHCQAIQAVKFNGPVTTLGEGAFEGTSLKAFEFPKCLAEADNDVFLNCGELAEVTFERGSPLKRIREFAFAGTKIKVITIPQSVEIIERKAFATTGSLEEVRFEEGSACYCISIDAFWKSGIKVLTLPAKLLGYFFRCPNLAVFNVAKGNASFVWENEVLFSAQKTVIFFVARGLEERFEVQNNVTSIQRNAFADCGKITSVNFGEGSELRRIEARAFFASGLTAIRIPKKVIEIEDRAFSGCERLKHVEFQEGSELTRIGPEVFRHSGIEQFKGPPNLGWLECGVFAYAGSLHSVILPHKIVCVRPSTFNECNKLQSVTSELQTGTIIVQGRGFSSRFARERFHVKPGVTAVWLEADQLYPPIDRPAPPPKVQGEQYEKGKVHGSPPG
jgi:hypothetical protein